MEPGDPEAVSIELAALREIVDKLETEINCAEVEADSWVAELPDDIAEKYFSDSFDCIGDYISAMRKAIKEHHERP
jgi:hypothetical protein